MTTNELSRTTLLASALLFGAGVLIGLPIWQQADPARHTQVPGTAEWPQFIALTLLTAAAALFAVLRRGPGVLLAPFSRRAAARLSVTMRDGGIARRIAVGLVVLLNAYDLGRSGAQVTGGLDPDFTTNAWGGPSYLGAMYCHYLFGVLIAAVSAVILNRLLLRPVEVRAGQLSRR